MWGWMQILVLRLYQVSWRCSESGGEGCDGGWRPATALPMWFPPAGKTSLRLRIVGNLWMPGDCTALATPAASCRNASWMSYPWPQQGHL
jgi:hypothetical protein